MSDLEKFVCSCIVVVALIAGGALGYKLGAGPMPVADPLITVVVVANNTPVLYKDCKRASASSGVCYFTTDQGEEIATTFPCAISKVTK